PARAGKTVVSSGASLEDERGQFTDKRTVTQCRHLLFVTSKYKRRIPVYFSFNKLAFTSLPDVTILSQNFSGETQLDSCSCNKTNKAS
ncbi:hypothetical protein, partial [Serratia sp. ME43]|uniref:hypothetical protein n=1 Tax=Serratia sp. ME43 TaxID=2744256 RepID=UPI001C71557D